LYIPRYIKDYLVRVKILLMGLLYSS